MTFVPAPQPMLDAILGRCTFDMFYPPGLYFLNGEESYWRPDLTVSEPTLTKAEMYDSETSDEDLLPIPGRYVGGVSRPVRPPSSNATLYGRSDRITSAAYSTGRPQRGGSAADARHRVPAPADGSDDGGSVDAEEAPRHGAPLLHRPQRGLLPPPPDWGSVTYRLLDVGVPGIAPTVLFEPLGGTSVQYAVGNVRSVTVSAALMKRRGVFFRMGPGVVAFRVVLNVLKEASVFHTTTSRWNLLWAKRMQPPDWLIIGPFERSNHHPGSWGIGRKDNLSAHMMAMAAKFPRDFDFAPHTWSLPADSVKLSDAFAAAKAHGQPMFCILKPPAMSCGKGIKIISAVPAPTTSPSGKVVLKRLVQQYIAPPACVAGHKFDLRLYVVVTSIDPLRIYLFDDGLVRFASQPYVSPAVSKSKFVHLTNFAVNKDANFAVNKDAADQRKAGTSAAGVQRDSEDSGDDGRAEGGRSATGPYNCGYGEEPFKWSISELRRYYADHGIDWAPIAASIHAVIIKTIISVEHDIISACGSFGMPHRDACFELYGFDVMLDSNFKAYIIEVNIMPSLGTTTELDTSIKRKLIAGILTMCGTTPYDRAVNKAAVRSRTAAAACPARRFLNSSAHDTRSRIASLATNRPLEMLPLDPMDLYVLASSEAEARRGLLAGFSRIFPTAFAMERFGHLFSGTRYFSMLVSYWESEKLRWLQKTASVAPEKILEASGAAGLLRSQHRRESLRSSEAAAEDQRGAARRPARAPAKHAGGSTAPDGAPSTSLYGGSATVSTRLVGRPPASSSRAH